MDGGNQRKGGNYTDHLMQEYKKKEDFNLIEECAVISYQESVKKIEWYVSASFHASNSKSNCS